MPTDEQRMREQFEKWVIQDMARFAAPDSSPAELRANVERRFERDKKTGLYIDECIRDRYRGYQARDAEVQALREALEELVSIVEIDQRYRGQAWAFAELDFARAALAGGEAGETE